MKDTILKFISFIPVLAFFAVYKGSGDLILGTAVLVVGVLLSSILEFVVKRSISRMQIFMVAAVLVFGIPTVLLRDPAIIKWKVTAVNLILATLIFVTQYLMKKNPLAYLFGQELKLPPECWKFLASGFMYFFLFAAALNVVIAFYLPDIFGISPEEAESWWVDYKTFGNGILNLLFAAVCILLMLKKHPQLLSELKK